MLKNMSNFENAELLRDIDSINTRANGRLREQILKPSNAAFRAAADNSLMLILLTEGFPTDKPQDDALRELTEGMIRKELKEQGLPDTPETVAALFKFSENPNVIKILSDRGAEIDAARKSRYIQSKPAAIDLEKEIKKIATEIAAQQAKVDAAKKRLDTAK